MPMGKPFVNGGGSGIRTTPRPCRDAVTPPRFLQPAPPNDPIPWGPLAEGVGFEPTEHLAMLNGFQDRCNHLIQCCEAWSATWE